MEKSTNRQIVRFLVRFVPVASVIAISLIVGASIGISLGTLLRVIPLSALIVALWSLASGSSPRRDEIMETVYSSSPDEWKYSDSEGKYSDSEGKYTYKKNTDLRLEDEDYQSRVDFDECWVQNYENPTAYRRSLYIYYKSSLIDKKTIIQADETRVFIPLPTASDLIITQDEHQLGRIINYCKQIDGSRGDHVRRYKEYLDLAEITVQSQNQYAGSLPVRIMTRLRDRITVFNN